MKTTAIMLSGVALLALSACGKGEDKAAGTGASGTSQTAEEVASEMKKVSLQPGQWETTSEIVDVTMENAPQGMPAGMLESMKGHKTTFKHCLTPEQAEKPDADFMSGQKDSKCTYSGFSMSGGAVKGTVSCPSGEGGGTATISMEGIYTPASYTMNMTMDGAGMGGGGRMPGGMSMHMKMKTTGKRTGECPAAPEGQ